MKLYDLTAELMALQNMLEDDDVEADVLADTLESVQGEYDVKIEAYAKVLKNLEADVEAIKAEADRLTGKRKALETNVDKLKKAMFDSMKATNTPKVKGTLFTIAIQKNGGKIPVEYDKDNKNITATLPDNLVIISEKPDLDAIRELLESGKAVEGFKLGERGESIRIK